MNKTNGKLRLVEINKEMKELNNNFNQKWNQLREEYDSIKKEIELTDQEEWKMYWGDANITEVCKKLGWKCD